jgi:Xaa-Pro aminopeptidase
MNYRENIDARGGTFNAVGRDQNNIVTIGHQTVTINVLADSGQTLQDVAALRTKILPVALGLDSQIHDTLAFPNESKSKATQGDTMGFETDPLVHADTTEHTLSKWSYRWGIGKRRKKETKLVEQELMGSSPHPPLHHSNTRTHSSNKANQAEMSGIGEYSTDSGETSCPIRPNGSQSLFIGSAFAKRRVDTSDRLDEMRKLMAMDTLDY